ncbi:leucine-rich repeat [Anaeramoeba flamelloides]|uniref:Leucine-rich repeat n=1 Tax=Anaeramoeba flamelloides TaxID=1746091 RepID=A0ABQ8Y051_9EUKA|nr:leucine-rich repeat [Anaeramoeba flamelloides]
MSDSLPSFVITEITEKEKKKATKLFFQETNQQEIHYMNWFNKRKFHKGKTKRIEKRILIVSDYWIATIGKRKSSLGKVLCRKEHITFLKEVKRFSQYHSRLMFKDFLIDMHSTESDAILRAVIERNKRITQGTPTKSQMCIVVPKSRIEDFDLQISTKAGGFIETYSSWCSYYKSPTNPNVLGLVEKKEERNNGSQTQNKNQKKRILEIDQQIYFKKDAKNKQKEKSLKNKILSVNEKEIFPLILAFQNNRYFQGLCIKNLKEKTLLGMVGKMMLFNRCLTKLSIINSQSFEGLEMLAISLMNNTKSKLTHLNLSGSKFTQQNEAKKFFYSFSKMNTGLKFLDLSNCKISPSLIVDLFEGLFQNEKHLSMKKLLLSHNSFGKKGSIEMAKWLTFIDNRNVVKEIDISYSKISIPIILESLSEHLSNQNLEKLNLSGNKIKKSNLKHLIKMLKNTTTLRNLNLSKTNLNGKNVGTVIETILKNENLHDFCLNLSNNNLGFEGGKQLKNILQVDETNILKELILDDCNFGVKGINAFCKCLSKTQPIRQLSISRNVPKGKFAQVRDAIALLFNNKSGLEYLRIRGDSKHSFGEGFKTIFSELPKNNKLICLDITGNFIGHKAFITLIGSLNTESIETLYFDKNNLTFSSIENFDQKIKENDTLFDIKWPEEDFLKILSKTKKRDLSSIKKQLLELKKSTMKKLNTNKSDKIPRTIAKDIEEETLITDDSIDLNINEEIGVQNITNGDNDNEEGDDDNSIDLDLDIGIDNENGKKEGEEENEKKSIDKRKKKRNKNNKYLNKNILNDIHEDEINDDSDDSILKL